MNPIQLSLLVVFLAALVVSYWPQISTFAKSHAHLPPKHESSIAVKLVGDLLAITELRDKLAAEGYQEGVDACTTLLRVIVEHKQNAENTAKGAV
jgi:hypothetical protein